MKWSVRPDSHRVRADLQTAASTDSASRALVLKWGGRPTGAAPVRRSSQDRMLAVTSRPPFEIGILPPEPPRHGLLHERGELLMLYPGGVRKRVRHAGAAPALCLWKRQVLSVTPMARMKVAAALGVAPNSRRLQRGANLSQRRSKLPFARYAPRFLAYREDSAFELRRNRKWSRASVLPRVSHRPKRFGLLSSSRAIVEIGGLCGHCSRDLPLDPALRDSSLLSRKWWVVSAMLRRWFCGTSALQAARDLYATNNPEWVAGAGIEPARSRLMRPVPSHLAPPRLKIWHGGSVLPRGWRGFGDQAAQLAPAV